MMRRSLFQAARPSARLLSGFKHYRARQFSFTASYGVKAVFTETQNSQLNEVLREIQNKIILPSYLPAMQRDLVFDATKKAYIQQNPIIIELEGLEHKFSFINRFKDLPNAHKIFRSALGKMHSKEDFDAIATLLAGYKKAGIKMKPFHYMTMIREAGKNGQIFSVIECAKQADETGFQFSDNAYVVAIMNWINRSHRAEAAKWSDVMLDILQRPPHLKQGEIFELHPLVAGQINYAQALNIRSRLEDGEDVEKQKATLKDGAQRLSKWWAHHLAETPDIPASIVAMTSRQQKRGDPVTMGATDMILAIGQTVKGMSLCREWFGDEVESFELIEKRLDSFLGQFLQRIKMEDRSDYKELYKFMTDKDPEWNVPDAAALGQ